MKKVLINQISVAFCDGIILITLSHNINNYTQAKEA